MEEFPGQQSQSVSDMFPSLPMACPLVLTAFAQVSQSDLVYSDVECFFLLVCIFMYIYVYMLVCLYCLNRSICLPLAPERARSPGRLACRPVPRSPDSRSSRAPGPSFQMRILGICADPCRSLPLRKWGTSTNQRALSLGTIGWEVTV